MANSSVKLDVTGIDKLMREEPQKAERWLDGVADQMLGDIVLSFGTSPAGESYQRGGVTHIASQPGYPPNKDTASLAASMHVEPAGALARNIADGVEHGIFQEDGTEDVRPRPFVQPVFDDWSKKIGDDAKKNLKLE